MSGFAFAAIYKEPTPPIGPGPDGPDIPPVDPDDDPSYYTYTISGESITPFVPFTVTVTGSNSKAKGNHGNLQADINYEIRDGGAWEGGKCEWTLGTWVCDSKRTNAKFSWLISGREPVTATLAYDAGTMEPEIEDSSVVLGKTFDFSITFSGAGDDCYATRLGDFGASYWWEAFKNGKWEKTTRIAESQTRFSKGVLSGTGHVGNLAGYEKIRLCVNYAGLETAYDEATVTSAEVTITLGDDALHCWGAGTQLKIESDTLEYMTAAFYRGGDTTEDITDTQGEPIVFGFTGTSWQGDIQAAGGATAGTVVLKVMYNGVVQATKEITIETEFLADITVSGQSIIQGNSFDMSGSVASTMGELSRIPANAFKLVAVQGETVLAQVFNTAGIQEVEYEGVTPTAAGTVYVRIIDNRDGTTVAEEEVTVQSVKFALADAINERILANTGTAGTYSDEDSASTLRTAAISAINGYAKSAIAADGTFTAFSSSNHGIATAEETTQWYAETYAIVKSAVAKPYSMSSGNIESSTKRKRTGTVYCNTIKDENDDVTGLEPLSSFIERACGICNAAQWEDESQYEGDIATVKSITGQEGYFNNKNSYSQHWCSVLLDCCAKRYKIGANIYVSGRYDLYFTGSGYNISSYSTFGHRAPSASGATEKLGSINITAGTDSYSDWFGVEYSGLTISGNSYTGSVGYKMSFTRGVIHYNFNHK